MNATELFIGDIVMVSGKPMHVTLAMMQAGIEVKPIPLTPEILETNGFECTRGGKFAGVFNVADRYECAIKNERGGTEWWIDIQDLGEREETLWMIHIQGHRNVSGYWGYVHELQHAIKLCGIKKEVVVC